MIQKFVSTGFLVAACLLSALPIKAATPIPPQDPPTELSAPPKRSANSDMVEAKFRKLQKEMEGGNSGQSNVNPGNESTTPTSKNLQAPEPRSAASVKEMWKVPFASKITQNCHL